MLKLPIGSIQEILNEWGSATIQKGDSKPQRNQLKMERTTIQTRKKVENYSKPQEKKM